MMGTRVFTSAFVVLRVDGNGAVKISFLPRGTMSEKSSSATDIFNVRKRKTDPAGCLRAVCSAPGFEHRACHWRNNSRMEILHALWYIRLVLYRVSMGRFAIHFHSHQR